MNIIGSPTISAAEARWLLIGTVLVVLWCIHHILVNRRIAAAKTAAEFIPDPTVQVSYRHENVQGDDLIVIKYQDGHEVYVCDTCGGNCGQCGMTSKFARLNGEHGTPSVDLNFLIKATKMDQPVMGFRRG